MSDFSGNAQPSLAPAPETLLQGMWSETARHDAQAASHSPMDPHRDSPLANEGVLLAGLLALFLCRAIIANAVVPPWQGPDEPGHFAVTYGLTRPTIMRVPIEAGVLRSMERHRWWALYDDLPPYPLDSFNRVYGVGGGNLAQPLYYSLGALALGLSRPVDLETAYYHLRFLGVLLAVVALGFGWAGTRLMFGPEVAVGALAIGALHPQFLLASISVNADALVNVWGALVWWQAARVLTGHRRALSVILMLVGAVAALFTKRIGMILVGVSLVVAVAPMLLNRTWRLQRREALLMTMVAAICVCMLVVMGVLFREPVSVLWAYWRDAFTPRTSLADATGSEALRFARMTVDYFWLIAGWLRFQPPASWLWVARILIVAGLVGALIQLITARTGRLGLSLAWLFVIAQLVAMLATVFWLAPSAPQARYLFPVFVPITALLYVGLGRLVPPNYQSQWPVALVAVLLILDVTGFTTVDLQSYIP